MFEILHSAMQKNRAVFIEDAFLTFCDKGCHVTAANFFSLNDAATFNLMKRLEEIAGGRRVDVSLNKDEEQAPEALVLASHGYEKTKLNGGTQHWEKDDAQPTA